MGQNAARGPTMPLPFLSSPKPSATEHNTHACKPLRQACMQTTAKQPGPADGQQESTLAHTPDCAPLLLTAHSPLASAQNQQAALTFRDSSFAAALLASAAFSSHSCSLSDCQPPAAEQRRRSGIAVLASALHVGRRQAALMVGWLLWCVWMPHWRRLKPDPAICGTQDRVRARWPTGICAE